LTSTDSRGSLNCPYQLAIMSFRAKPRNLSTNRLKNIVRSLDSARSATDRFVRANIEGNPICQLGGWRLPLQSNLSVIPSEAEESLTISLKKISWDVSTSLDMTKGCCCAECCPIAKLFRSGQRTLQGSGPRAWFCPRF